VLHDINFMYGAGPSIGTQVNAVTQFQLLLSEPCPEVLVFELSGELDLGTLPPLGEAAAKATADDYQVLVFDLSRLDFMDSAGLHLLAETHRAMDAKGQQTVVVCSAPMLLNVFELTGLDQLLTIVGTREQALAGHLNAA
jgi:anti-sigma B factor antagonist